MLNDACYPEMSAALEPDDFSLEKHKRIFARMEDLSARGEAINRVTLANELMKQGQLESVDGLTYIVSLDQGLPELVNLSSYIGIVREKANLRKIIWESQRRIDQALLELPSRDIVTAGLQSLQGISDSRERDKGATVEQIINAFPGAAPSFLDPSQRPKGLPSGFTKFDEATSGIHAGELTVLGARPGMGKSAMLQNVVAHLCLHPKQRRMCSIFSLEMTDASILTRFVCSGARVDAHKFRSGFLNSDERRRLQMELFNLTESRLKIYDRFGITMPELEDCIRRDVADHGCSFVGIDYLQLIGVKKKGERRDLDIGDITRRLKILTKECNIPIWVLSQLSRAADKRTGSMMKPQLSDLRESGSIEQDADNVLFIDREEVYKRDREDLKGLADLMIAKQRNGPLTNVPLRFLGQFVRFESKAEDLEEIPGEFIR